MLGFAPIASEPLGSTGATGGGVVITPTAPVASLITLTGPSTGEMLAASAPFTVGTDYPVSSPVAITPYAVGGGYFAPNTVVLTSTSPTATFLYVPDSTGAKSINVMNGIGLAPASSIAYTATASTAPAPVAAPQAGDWSGSHFTGWREDEWKKRQAERDSLADEIRAAAAEVAENAAKAARAAMLAMKAKKVIKKRSRFF